VRLQAYVSGTVSSAVGAAENIYVDEPVETDIENTAIASPSGSLETRSELKFFYKNFNRHSWKSSHQYHLCHTSTSFRKAVETTTSGHTGEYIAKILSTEIESVGASKVQAVVTDNASNMKLAWKLLKDKYPHLVTFGCLAHDLNLLAKDINNTESIKNVIGICKIIINFSSNHHVANQPLKKIQKEKDGKESVLSLPMKQDGAPQRDVWTAC
jgi:hypothetical protein